MSIRWSVIIPKRAGSYTSVLLSEQLFLEHVFKDGESEDDGVVITTVFDGVTKKSFVLLLDAITFTVNNKKVTCS